MTLPTIVPINFQGTRLDFLHTKLSRDGDMSLQTSQVSVPAATPNATIVGLVPFNRGFRPAVSSISIQTDALGTGATFNLGYVYNDNVTFTNNQTAFGTGYSAATAGSVSPDNTAATVGRDFVAAADGWLVATFTGTVPAATGNLTTQCEFVYDGVNTSN